MMQESIEQSGDHNNGVQQDPDRLSLLLKMRREGYTLKEIEDQVGVSASRVGQIARRMIPQWRTTHAISKELNISVGRLRRLLIDNDIKPLAHRGQDERPVYDVEEVCRVLEPQLRHRSGGADGTRDVDEDSVRSAGGAASPVAVAG